MHRCKGFVIVFFAWAPVAFGQPVAQTQPAGAPTGGLMLINWQDAGKHVGEKVIVQGRIVQAKNIGALCFLNFDAGRSFTAVVRQANYKNFPKSPDQMYGGKLVQITGRIGVFRGKPELEVMSASSVRIIDKEEPVTSQPATPPARAFDGTVTVATYNVLNLFDEFDDPYREDEGTPKKPDDQLRCLAGSIRSIDADVLCVEEIENREVLEAFARGQLFGMGYREVVSFESNDVRGIECGVLSKFPVGPVTSHRFRDFEDGEGGKIRFRRDLLQVRIEPPGYSPFDVFVVHLKSKRGDAESTLKDRMGEARAIQVVLGGILKADPEAKFIICGDFNDTADSKPLQMIRNPGTAKLVDFLSDLAPGTNSYNQGQHAGLIDFIFASPGMARGYEAKSYQAVAGSISTTGSDHNPVVARFRLEKISAGNRHSGS